MINDIISCNFLNIRSINNFSYSIKTNNSYNIMIIRSRSIKTINNININIRRRNNINIINNNNIIKSIKSCRIMKRMMKKIMRKVSYTPTFINTLTFSYIIFNTLILIKISPVIIFIIIIINTFYYNIYKTTT